MRMARDMSDDFGLGSDPPDLDPRILNPGVNCWRIDHAARLNFLIDSADYFAALKSALLRARHSIWILAWTFDPLTRLTPDTSVKSGDPEHADRLGLLLRRMAALNPALDVRILAWDMAPPIAVSQLLAPQRAMAYFHDSRVKFRLDSSVPLSACHHQKVVVIDGRVAFVSGGDMGPDRWDTCHHADHDPRRRLPNGKRYPARHEVSMVVEGPAATALGDLFALRWKRALGETVTLPPEPIPGEDSPWPPELRAHLKHQPLAIARTLARWRKSPGAYESLRLHLDSIASARRLIFLENQYLASPLIVEALAGRLLEQDGPEIVTIGPMESPSYFDQMTMDSARASAIARLQATDLQGRFRAFSPRTPGDNPVIVHSKVSIIDDRLLRIGSANLNNRSTGLDSECDVALEAEDGEAGEAAREAIRAFRARLVGHYMERDADEVRAAMAAHGGLGEAIDALDRHGEGEHRRLRPFESGPLGWFARFVAKWSLGDPTTPQDAWNPWNRRNRLRRDLEQLLPCVMDQGDECEVPAEARGKATVA
jgi:phosphatidylserine/phosphatidylglycerophosphate/cardiolipin synthase-like enzyme